MALALLRIKRRTVAHEDGMCVAANLRTELRHSQPGMSSRIESLTKVPSIAALMRFLFFIAGHSKLIANRPAGGRRDSHRCFGRRIRIPVPPNPNPQRNRLRLPLPMSLAAVRWLNRKLNSGGGQRGTNNVS
jgi:hypothetical protein